MSDFSKILPRTIFCYLLQFLGDKDLCSVKLVSKTWKEKSEYDPLWKELTKKYLKVDRQMSEIEVNQILSDKEKNHKDWFHFYTHVKRSRYLICTSGGNFENSRNFVNELNTHLPFPSDMITDKDPFTLDTLSKYNAVLMFSMNSFFNDDIGKGDVLYEYVKNGGGVVVMCYTTCGCPLLGKWESNDMTPVIPQQSARKANLYLDFSKSEKDHPILANVEHFHGDSGESIHGPGELQINSKAIARYDNDKILVAEKILDHNKGFGRVVALNTIGVSNKFSVNPPGWKEDKNGYTLFKNCLNYVKGICRYKSNLSQF